MNLLLLGLADGKDEPIFLFLQTGDLGLAIIDFLLLLQKLEFSDRPLFHRWANPFQDILLHGQIAPRAAEFFPHLLKLLGKLPHLELVDIALGGASSSRRFQPLPLLGR